MPFSIDYRDGDVLEWHCTETGAEHTRVTDYTPTLYVGADADHTIEDVRPFVAGLIDVVDTGLEEWRPGFRHGAERMLRIDVADIDAVTRVAGHIRDHGQPGAYRCFNVDLSREFRYCLEQAVAPVPTRDLRELSIEVANPAVQSPPITELTVGGESVSGSPRDLVEAIDAEIAATDPDVLCLDTAELVPALFEMAENAGFELQLGRLPGWTQRAGRSTYESYGQVGHSPARYNVPGRVLIDRSNTFFLQETNLAGCLDLVARSWKPLQELAWASIGNVLTAIQIREALSRGVLVPWKSWRHEFFKSMAQLDAADRGGYIFSPEVGFHEDVHELDFASLYPNIICTRNVSPDTIRCDCHQTRTDVPELGYSICDDRGYLPDVLEPLIDARQAIKAELEMVEDPERRAALEGKSSAIKWILVSCFGYQGFSNAKFGRIECHEAINAYAREILLTAKERLEDGGWRVVHGIIDSLWVTPREGAEQTPLGELANAITDAVGIPLEYEGAYDWLAFVPLRDSDAGALTKYFGAKRDASEYKYRGIECRQRSTCEFVADTQRDLIGVLDAERSPEAVCDHLRTRIADLHAGRVDPDQLQLTTRTSKRLEEYQHSTRTVAALERAAANGLDVYPGQDIEYVVVNDEREGCDRVRLAHESVETYDADFYRERLLRAAASVCAPLGWRQDRISQFLGGQQDTRLENFGSIGNFG